MELPFQPAGFSELNPGPEPEPELCSFSLLFLQDILSNQEFLVDSGATVSMFLGPRSDSSDGVGLLTADGSLMVCSGTKIIPLGFSCRAGSKVYTWTFQLPPVSVPLLGADFLEHFNLLAKQLLASVPVLPHPEPGAPVSLAVDASDSHICTVLQQKLQGL